MLISELTSYASETDIICLQEVDRLPTFLPFLSHSHGSSSAKGPKKQHGLVILHRESIFNKKEERVIYLDEVFARGEGEKDEDGKLLDARGRRGGTRETKNIGLMVALERKDGKGGVVRLGQIISSRPLYRGTLVDLSDLWLDDV